MTAAKKNTPTEPNRILPSLVVWHLLIGLMSMHSLHATAVYNPSDNTNNNCGIPSVFGQKCAACLVPHKENPEVLAVARVRCAFPFWRWQSSNSAQFSVYGKKVCQIPQRVTSRNSTNLLARQTTERHRELPNNKTIAKKWSTRGGVVVRPAPC